MNAYAGPKLYPEMRCHRGEWETRLVSYEWDDKQQMNPNEEWASSRYDTKDSALKELRGEIWERRNDIDWFPAELPDGCLI